VSAIVTGALRAMAASPRTVTGVGVVKPLREIREPVTTISPVAVSAWGVVSATGLEGAWSPP